MKRSVFELDFQNQDLDSKIVTALERVGAALRVMLWRESYPLTLSPIQAQVLIFVLTHRNEYCTVSYLANEFNMTKPTISEAVRTLESKGLVEKVPLRKDQRTLTIHLTGEGEKLARQAAQYTSVLHDILRTLPSQFDKEQLLGSLIEIIRQLQQQGVISVQRMCFNCVHYRHAHEGHTHFCNLLGKPLQTTELRIDCPEFEEAG